jgi:3-phenylpropionate/trans-cinnamate dioxygenase ferredoxin reductase subunit
LTINGKDIQASPGETLIDAALGGWMIIPHDCRSGQCESCRVTVVSGSVDDRGTSDGRTVLACQATVAGNASIEFDELPVPQKASGAVTAINPLSHDVVEVVVSMQSALDYRPGQYVRVKFAGLPAREYSPTVRMDGTTKDDEMVFHVRCLPDGRVSSEIGRGIVPGTRVHIQGPFGQAYLRQSPGPLVLVSGGTGFAPIWSLARAARAQQRTRKMIVIAGAPNPQSLYMRRALDWLVDDGVEDVVATSEAGAQWPNVRGRPTDYLPLVGIEDTVYVAGPVGLVDAVKRKARHASARCYADPFLPSSQAASVTDRVMGLFRGGLKARPPVGEARNNLQPSV